MTKLASTAEHLEHQQDLTLFKVYTFYRTILACALLFTFVVSPSYLLVGGVKPELFIYSTSTYLAVNLIVLFVLLPRKVPFNSQHLFVNFAFDIIAIILIADSTGGITSGLGILLVVSIAASSMILKNQLATLIAAMASLAIIADTARLISQQYLDISSFLPSGLLGFILFITSFLIQNLAQRMRQVQLMAKQSASDLSKLQHLNQLIVQRMRTGILVASSEGKIQMHNEAATKLLGASSSDNNAQTLLVLPHNLRTLFNQWKQSPQFHAKPFQETSTGPELLTSFSALTEEGGSVLIFLEDNRHLAQRAQQMKLASLGRLTASIAHEIRNPLSAVNHAAQLLEESQSIHSNDKRLCEIIQNHSRRMNKIIENVLQLSQRQAPNPERVQLYQWLNQFLAELETKEYSDKDIHLMSSTQQMEVTVDLSQLSQVLTNLIQNGLRHSHQLTGKATLTLYFHINLATHLPVLDIIDDGPGISEQNKDNIFEPFFTTETSGTGLGLYISRELCEANQSRLDYIRTYNDKSCFRISFAHPDRRLAPD